MGEFASILEEAMRIAMVGYEAFDAVGGVVEDIDNSIALRAAPVAVP